ncbi:MAG: hypothetical protein R2731_10305 [Nocardioides sp.]
MDVEGYSSGPISVPRPRRARRGRSAATTSAPAASIPSCLKLDNNMSVTFDLVVRADRSFHGEILMKEPPWLPDVPGEVRTCENLVTAARRGFDVEVAPTCGLSSARSPPRSPRSIPLNSSASSAGPGGQHRWAMRAYNIGAEASAGVWFDTQFGVGVDNFADWRHQHRRPRADPQAALVVDLPVTEEFIFAGRWHRSPRGYRRGVRAATSRPWTRPPRCSGQAATRPEPDTCVKVDPRVRPESRHGGEGVALPLMRRRSPSTSGDSDRSYGGPWYFPTDCETPGGNDIYILELESGGQRRPGPGVDDDLMGYSRGGRRTMPVVPSDYRQIWSRPTPATPMTLAALQHASTGGSVFCQRRARCCGETNADLGRS